MNNCLLREGPEDASRYQLSVGSVDVSAPQNLEHTAVEQRDNEGRRSATFRISDSRAHAVSSMCVTFAVEQVKGRGAFRMLDWFGFRLIHSVEVYQKDLLMKSMTGFEMLQTYLTVHGPHETNDRVGHLDSLCRYMEGRSRDDVVSPRVHLRVPLVSTWDTLIPHTVLATSSQGLKVVVVFNRVADCMVQRVGSSLEYEEFPQCPGLVCKYYPCPPVNKRMYLEQVRSVCDPSFVDGRVVVTPQFKSVTSVHYVARAESFDAKTFMAYPGGLFSLSDLRDQFVRRFCRDMITVLPEDAVPCEKCARPRWDGISHTVGCTALHILRREYGAEDLRGRRFALNPAKVHVHGATNLFVCMNSLTFTRQDDEHRLTDVYSLIDDFVGIYNGREVHQVTVRHRVPDALLSVPVEIWNHDLNIANGDLRKPASRARDVRLTDPWVAGMDFFGSAPGFTNVSISAGSNAIFVKNKYGGIAEEEYASGLSGTFRLAPLGPDAHARSLTNYTFNNSDPNVFSPSRLQANRARNFTKLDVSVDWESFPKHSPLSVVRRRLVVFLVQPLTLLAENDVITVTDI